MSETNVKNIKNTSNLYAEKGKKGVKKGNPGRPKGAKDKISRTVKENIEETFQKLGGIEGLVKWAEKSNHNKTKLYDWYFSMLPKSVDATHSGQIDHVVFMMPRPKGKSKKKNAASNK